MIDIVKLLNGNVAIYDNSSGDFIFSMSPAIIEMQCATNGIVRVVQNNDNFEFFDPAQVANTQVLPAAAIPFTGTCADLADILATDFFFELAGDDLASILSNGNNAGANDIDMNGNDILNVTNINGSPYPPTSLGTVTSVGLTMPTAFNVANSPITSAGNINVTGAGLTSQYIRGDGSLANFPTNVGGGSSVSYYLNGSINQGTFVGNVYHQMSKTAILGSGTNFTINADGYIAQFITDAGDPALLNIPAGNWDFQLYFSASSSGGSPQFYTELYKYDGTTFTLIASGSTSPENITGGTFADVYVSTLAVPATTLTLTDRLAIRVYVIHSGRIITLYTEDNKLAEIHTTFSTGIAALNGLTSQIQNFATGTTGTDFNISSSTATHTFNIPTASALNRGLLSTTDWNTFNGKQNALGYTPVTNARTLTINGTTYDLTADRTWSVGTVTSVAALTLGTSGTDLSSTVATGTSTPVITLNVPTASATNRGVLSSSDWSAFNGKQNALVSGTNIKTVQSTSLLGSGNVLITDANLSMSDITTNNVSTTQHGFVPKAPNSTSQFLRGDGTWATVPASDPAGWTYIVKSANQDVTNNAIFQDDTELQFSVVAGGHYMVEMSVCWSGNNATSDYDCRILVTAGVLNGYGIAIASDQTTLRIIAGTSASTSIGTLNLVSTNIDFLNTLTLSFNFNPSSNATFIYQFRNASAGAGRISRTWKGSILKYKRID